MWLLGYSKLICGVAVEAVSSFYGDYMVVFYTVLLMGR